MHRIFSNGMLAEYVQQKDVGGYKHGNDEMPRKKQGVPGLFLSSVANAADELNENRLQSGRFSKDSSTFGHLSHKAGKCGNAGLRAGYGGISDGPKKYGADFSPEVYEEIFRRPAKISSTSKFSDLPVLDPTAYYDEENMFSNSPAMRNGSAAGVIYEDVFGGGLAAGPTYADLNELLECFTASNSRSGGASSSSSGQLAQSPYAKTSSFQHESDNEERFYSRHSSRSESTLRHFAQSRSTNVLWHNVEEEPYTKLTRQHSGYVNLNGLKRASRSAEARKETINGVLWQQFEPSISLHSWSTISTDTDPIPAVQGSRSKDFSGQITQRKNSSSHDYTRDWLKSVNFRNISFSYRESENSLSPKHKEEMLYEGDSSPSKIYEPIQTCKYEKIAQNGAHVEKTEGQAWLSLDDLRLKTSPSVTPPPARLPPLPRDKPNPLLPTMSERQSQEIRYSHSKVCANGVCSKRQETIMSTDADPELSSSMSPANDEEGGDRSFIYKEVNVYAAVEHTRSKIVKSSQAESLNKLELEGEVFTEAAERKDSEKQVNSTDDKDNQLQKHPKGSARDWKATDYVNEVKKEKAAVKNEEQKKEELADDTTLGQLCCTEQKERDKTISHLAHKVADMLRSTKAGGPCYGIDRKELLDTVARTEEHEEEEIMRKNLATKCLEENQWKTISANYLEHDQEEMMMNARSIEHSPGIEQKPRILTAAETENHGEEQRKMSTSSLGSQKHENEECVVNATAVEHAYIKERKERTETQAKNRGHKEESLHETASGHTYGIDQKQTKKMSFREPEHKEQLLEMNAAITENVGAKQKVRKISLGKNEGFGVEEIAVHVSDGLPATKEDERKDASWSAEDESGKDEKELSPKKESPEEPEIVIQLTTEGQGSKEQTTKNANNYFDFKNIKDGKVAAAMVKQNIGVINSKSESETTDKQIRQQEYTHTSQLDEENKRSHSTVLEEKSLNPNGPGPGSKAFKEIKVTNGQNYKKDRVLNDGPGKSRDEMDWGVSEIEVDIRQREREYELERQKEREMEREKDRMGLGNKFSDTKGGIVGEYNVRLEKIAVNLRETAGRTPAEIRSRMSFTGAERSHSEIGEKVSERGMKLGDTPHSNEKTHNLTCFTSGSQQRTLDRVAKALAEKKQRDLEAQRESAEKERLAGSVNLEIKRWSSGKEGNLRALLSTLQYILWAESGWQTVSLTDIISSAAVKKAYRKATLCVHPDKVQQKGATIRQKYVAEKVFDLLKDAWNKFNLDEQK